MINKALRNVWTKGKFKGFSAQPILKTPLYDLQVQQGGKMIEFAGNLIV